jgi:sortase A
MKLIIAIIIIFLFGWVGGAVGSIDKITQLEGLKIRAEERIQKPAILQIPKLGVETQIEEVGKDEDGKMASPGNTENAGWYALGERPGETGSAVVAGHYDDEDGPSIFFRLGELTRGDIIRILGTDGKTYEFEVFAVERYKDEYFPIDHVFSLQTGKYLNLITCDGWFSPQEQDYSERLVVFSKLVK